MLDDVRIVEAGNDELYGGSGSDNLFGGAGDDTLEGGEGTDTLTGDSGADTFFYNADIAAEGGDSITDFSGASGDGDMVDLQALNLNGGDTIPNLIAGGFIFVLGGDELYVDLDGGGVGGGDDILVATFTDGGAGFDSTPTFWSDRAVRP